MILSHGCRVSCHSAVKDSCCMASILDVDEVDEVIRCH